MSESLEKRLIDIGVAPERARAIASRSGPGWSEPIADRETRSAARRLADGDGALVAWERDVAAAGGRSLPEAPPHIARLTTISAEAKLILTIVEGQRAVPRRDVWRAIGLVDFELADAEWGPHLERLIAIGLVGNTSDGRLCALRRAA